MKKYFRNIVYRGVMLVLILSFAAACAAPPAATEAPPAPAVTEAPAQPAATEPPAQPEATEAPAMADCTPTGEVKRGGELTMARLEEPLTMDPVGPSDNGSIYLIELVYESLIEPDDTGAGLAPGLAESWEVSEDGLEYTFHLKDAKFSTGDPVTTDDVIFSLNRAANGEVSPYAFLFGVIDNIEAVDDKTIKVTLTEPTAPFLSSVAIFTASITPKAAVEADPEGFGNNPIGSGPFMVEEYTRGDQVVLVPNPYYTKLGVDCQPLPYLDRITVRYVPESNSRVLGLRNGDFDVIDNVPFNEGEALDAEAEISLGVDEIYKLDYLYINHSRQPFDNKDFRLALNYATDRQAILETVFFGYGMLPNSFMPKMNFWDANVELIPYDPAKAQELVASSGYDGAPFEILVPAGDAPRKQIAQILQQNWSAVGINATIVELDIGAAWEKVVAGEYDVEVNYITSDINDDDELATFQGDYWAPGDSQAFFSRYQSQEVADILKQARQTTDPAQRADLYSQAQNIAYWDGYSVPFNFTPALTGYWDYVQNFRTLTTGWWWLDQVWLDQ
jgi:peptide/nickel transport system substrate-binding protein